MFVLCMCEFISNSKTLYAWRILIVSRAGGGGGGGGGRGVTGPELCTK